MSQTLVPVKKENSDGVCSSPTIWEELRIPGDNLVELSVDRCLSHVREAWQRKSGQWRDSCQLLGEEALLGFS